MNVLMGYRHGNGAGLIHGGEMQDGLGCEAFYTPFALENTLLNGRHDTMSSIIL